MEKIEFKKDCKHLWQPAAKEPGDSPGIRLDEQNPRSAIGSLRRH